MEEGAGTFEDMITEIHSHSSAEEMLVTDALHVGFTDGIISRCETPSATDWGEIEEFLCGSSSSSETPADCEINSSETPSDSADADSYQLNNNNMFNCYKHRQHLFNRCKDGKIHRDVLISFWMMSGYLSPAESVDDAYNKGSRLLRDLIQGGLLNPSDEDPDLIKLAESKMCSHGLNPCDATRLGFVEMLEVDRIENVLLTDGMMQQRNCAPTQNYLCRQVFQSKRGLKYIAQFNPNPNYPLLDTIENPSALMIRVLDHHLFPVTAFTFENLKTLKVLEITGSGILYDVRLYHTISKLTQLQYLRLFDPLINMLPPDLFSKLVELRWLILRGCSRLHFFHRIGHLRNLEVLDLSYTFTTQPPATEAAGFPKYSKFRTDSPSRSHQQQQLPALHNQSEVASQLVVLDLSRTRIRFFANSNRPLLRNVILRECRLLFHFEWSQWNNLPTDLEVLDVSGCEYIHYFVIEKGSTPNIKELNLAGCSSLQNLGEGFFDQMTCLFNLDLSETKFKSLPSFANLISLRELKLRGLELDSLDVQTWTSLSNLVKLDLHGLKISTSEALNLDFLLGSLLKLQTLDLSKTSVAKLPDISNLVSLKELLLADCWNLKALPDLQPLTSLETLDVSLLDDPTGSCQLQVEPEGQRILPSSLRKLVLTNRPSVGKLFSLSSLGNLELLDLCGTDEIDFIDVPSSKKSENLQEQTTISKAVEFHIIYDVEHTGFDRFIYDFERIDDFISKIQVSSTRNTANTNSNQANFFMLHADLKYIRQNIDRLKGSHNSKSSNELLHELVDVATVNHFSADDFKDDSQNLKQLMRLFVSLKILFPTTQMNDRVVAKTTGKNKQPLFIKHKQNVSELDGEIANLQPIYQTLSRPQKNCLLCFSAFPCRKVEREKNTGVLKKSLVIKKSILINWWVSEGFLKANNFQDNGKQMLEDLIEKGFIEPVIKERRKSASFRMYHHVHSFVTAQAKSESFFDFDREKSNWLGLYVTRSNKDYQQKTQDIFSACAKLWANHKNLPRELDPMSNVSTLFNANGSVIDIKPEWLLKMRQLSTLSLGSWGCYENAKQSEIVDQKFLEELKSLKQLRFINLQGLMTIMKLPESICELSNLIILDLRECGYLEELPKGIGSLGNLIHLDLTDCVLLNKMPKGISLLSKLEVLKGFKITPSLWEKTMKGCMCMIHGKDNEVASLKDLSNLEKLYKLSLVVQIEEFPSEEDLEVLRGMKRLRKLKMLWERSIGERSIDSNYAASESSITGFSGNDWELEKLELWCIPYKYLPHWVFSMKLEKLYIMGGDLEQSLVDSEETLRGIKTLRLKYLQKTGHLRLPYFKQVFDGITYMEIKECSFCSNSIWWNNGTCIWNLPENSYPGVFFYSQT